MFDGNHRTRRQVNLSGNDSRSRRRKKASTPAAVGGVGGVGGGFSTGTTSTTMMPIGTGGSGAMLATTASATSREAILEESRRLREERQLQQQKNRSAKCVQRVYRGHACKQRIVREMDLQLLLSSSPSSAGPHFAALLDSLEKRTAMINFRLSFSIQESQWIDYCIDFAKRIDEHSNAVVTTTATASATDKDDDGDTTMRSSSSSSPPLPPLCHRILRGIWTLIQKGIRLNACATILRYCLRLPSSSTADQSKIPSSISTSLTSRTQQQQQQQQQQQSYYWKQLGGSNGVYGVFETLQSTIYRLNQSTTAISCETTELVTIASDLWEILLAVVMTPYPVIAGSRDSVSSGKAAIAALILSSQKDLFRDDDLVSLKSSSTTNAATTTTTATTTASPGKLLLDSFARRVLCVGGGGDGDGNSAISFANWSLFYQEWFYAMVRVLVQNHASNNNNYHEQQDPMITATRRIDTSSPSAQLTILSNALDLYYKLSSGTGSGSGSSSSSTCAAATKPPNPAPMLRLLQRVLETRSDLALLSSLFARGENITSIANSRIALLSASSASSSRMKRQDNDDDDDDDSDYDYDPMDTEHVKAPFSTDAVTSSKSRSTGGRLTKQDLLTVPKIDRNYFNNEVEKWRTEELTNLSVTPSEEDVTVRLALQICDGEQWIRWGMTLLSAPHDSEQLFLAQEAYITILASLLQTSTGLKARQSAGSPLLTKLAFNKGFTENLWRYVLVQLTNTLEASSQQTTFVAFSVFSDVFTHRLIALKDEKFLSDYTTMEGPRVILAENVIVRLRDMLYDLYWNKPVRASAVKIPFGRSLSADERFEALRGRLLLTGTKLFQALYDRWCRLVRHSPFCDESTWLFPHVSMSETRVVGMKHPGESGNDTMDLDSDSDDGDEPMSTFEAETEGLADAFADPKMARILTCIPQSLPFDRRVKLFSSLLASDKLKTQDEAAEMQQSLIAMMRGEEAELSGRERVAIHRDRLYGDSMRQLNRLGPKLRRRVQVTFINQHGAQEAGIDGGGVFKEFIDDLIREAFSPDGNSPQQLFTVTSLETLAVNPALKPNSDLLLHYEFLGRVLGKAVYECILVEPQFCLPFLNQMLGKTNSLEDLKNYDPEYYHNLTKLLTMSASEIDDVGLNFEIMLGSGSSSRTIELVPGGHGKHVTKQNVIQYVHLVAHQRLNVESAAQTKAFLRGFRDLIPASWVRLFSAYELQKIISGDDSIRGIDVSSLKLAMRYAAGYHPSQPIVQMFWEIIDEFSPQEQRKFLKFMTSCSRQPLLGFSSLDPPPCVQQIRLPDDMLEGEAIKKAPLPTSSTCMNLLKLPNYKSKELMRTKLLAAIESGAGFELS